LPLVQDSALIWMHRVALIAKKVIGQEAHLEKLLFFVRDWSHPEQFMPGSRGGREYLKSIFDNSQGRNERCDNRIRHLQQIFSSSSCYLFPFKNDDISFAQHWKASKLFLLYEGSGSEISLPAKEFYRLYAALQALESLQDYLLHLVESENSNVWTEARTNVSENSNIRAQEDENSCSETQESQDNPEPLNEESNIVEQDQDVDCPPELDASFLDLDEHFPDDCFNFTDSENPDFSFEPEFSSQSRPDSHSDKKITLQEYLANKSCPPNVSCTSEELSVNDVQSKPSEQPAASSYDDLLVKMKQDDPFANLGNLIKVPSIKLPDFLMKAAEVSPEIESNTKSTLQDKETNHRFSSYPTTSINRPTPPLLPTLFKCDSDATYNQDRITEEIPSITSHEEVIDLILSILNSRNLEDFFVTDVNRIVADGIRDAKQRGSLGLHKTQELLVSFMNIIFSSINSYIDAMDAAFQQHLYFQSKQDLLFFSKTQQDKIDNTHVIVPKSEACQKFLKNVKSKLEQHYLEVNEEIRVSEQRNLSYAMELALGFYESRLKSSINENPVTEDFFSQAHESLSRDSKKVLIHAYNAPDKHKTHLFMREFDDKLRNSFTKISQLYNKDRESKEIQRLAKHAASIFESEINRKVLQKDDISRESDFTLISQKIRKEIWDKLKPEWSSLSSNGLAELENHLQIKLDEVQTQKMSNFLANYQSRVPAGGHQNAPNKASDYNSKQGHSKEAPSQIGVHFGFEQLSAVLLIDSGGFRNLYGPQPNIITVLDDDILIGEHPSSSSSVTDANYSGSVHINSIFHNLNVEDLIEVGGKVFRIEKILAEVLSKLHLIVTETLHTEKVAYTIAVPTTLNPSMIAVIQDAIQIAGIGASIIRESHGLLCKFLSEHSHVVKNYTTVIAVVENCDESADACGFNVDRNEVNPAFLLGYDPSTTTMLNPKNWPVINGHWSFSNKSCLGLTRLINHISTQMSRNSFRNNCVKIVLECSNQNLQRNIEIIKKDSVHNSDWKLHSYSNSKPSIAEGAAMIGAYRCNSHFRNQWNQSRPKFGGTLLDGTSKLGSCSYRLMHSGYFPKTGIIAEASRKVQSDREQERAALRSTKAKAKKIFMEKTYEIQDRAVSVQTAKATEFNTKKLSDLLRMIDGEFQSVCYATKLMSEMESL